MPAAVRPRMSTLLKRHNKLLLHLGFWVAYASFFLFQISYGRRAELGWEAILPDFGFHLAGLLALSYVNYFVLLPRFLADRHLGRYLLRFAPVFAVGAYVFLAGKRAIIAASLDNPAWATSARFGVGVVLSTLLIVLFVGLLRFVEDYFANEARRKELENATLSSELRFLRAQVNPHFLFNTLNNLYFLAVNQSPQTPEVIAKLAGLMRYLLHDSNHALVPLEREIEYMRNYIDLERLRLDDGVAIEFDVTGDPAGVRVAPLILVTFLENAFKHGVSNGSAAQGAFIDVDLRVRAPSDLTFAVRNRLLPEHAKTVTEASGIGLANARRRLELGYPDGRHRLAVDAADDTYAVTLQLQLA